SFMNVEVWAPAWTQCEREDRAPDIFLSFLNESLGGGYRRELLFNPVIVFAVEAEISRRESSGVANVVSTLQQLARPKLAGYQRRPWGRTAGSGFTDSIQDLTVTGLFKPGPRHTVQVGPHLLAESWEPIGSESG